MTETIDKDILKDLEDLDNLDNYKGKWKNLTFLNNGESHFGKFSHDTEEGALETYEMVMNDDTIIYIRLEGGIIAYKSDISHAIQMPIGEE